MLFHFLSRFRVAALGSWPLALALNHLRTPVRETQLPNLVLVARHKAKSQWPRAKSLFIQRRIALLAHPHFAIAAHFMPDAHRPASGTDQLHVRDRDAALLLGDSALDVALRVGAHVLFHHHHVLDQNLAVVGKHAQHAPFLALVAPGNHLHGVVARRSTRLFSVLTVLMSKPDFVIWSLSNWEIENQPKAPTFQLLNYRISQ